MNNPKTLVVLEETHPLYKNISELYETRTPKEALASFDTYELVIDLTALRTKNKIIFLKDLARTTKAQIVSDLSLCWGEMVLKECPKVCGALSLLFFSPTQNVEFYSKSAELKGHIENFLNQIGKKGVLHRDLKLSFHYPRTIAMIINEAYFALEQNLATKEDIDLAMKNGVNYPLGPIEWAQKIGPKYIIELLSELSEITEDPRYRISKELKMTGKYL